MNVLVMNPGGNSLKVEIVSCSPTQQLASVGKKLVSLILEGIGKTPYLSVLDGKNPSHTEPISAKDYGEAAAKIFRWLENKKHIPLEDIHCVGVRVVHGGRTFSRATRVTAEVEHEINSFERLDDVMALLNKKSGLLGVSNKSLDTRVLMKDYGKDPRVTLAMDMFSYRVLKAVGAYLAALGGADAIVFGGGIGENTPLVRERVCTSLRWCGLQMDAEKNRTLIELEGKVSPARSPLQALVVLTEEGLQIAHESIYAP
jgi:acetate kinase